MKIKNTCGKIICFGTLSLLPSEIGTLPKEFEKNPVLNALIERDNITVLLERKVSDEVANDVEVPENLETLKKAELTAVCENLGIDVLDTDTKAVLIEKIKEATAE